MKTQPITTSTTLAMTDLNQTFAEINERGWRVSNLFQTDFGWQANIRTDTHYTEFGYGITPEEALSRAIDKIESAKAYEPKQTQYSIPTQTPSDLSAILAKLRPTSQIKRRI